MKRYSLFFLLSILFLSCEKKDKAITLPPKGENQMLQVDMGENYDYQFYINLETHQVVQVGRVDAWDLAFQSGSAESMIFLNGGKGMAAFNTHKTNFADVTYADTNLAKEGWAYDCPGGQTDSAALTDWQKTHPVYIIKLNESGTQLRKLQITYVDAFEFQIAVGDIGSAVPATFTIIKNGKCNFTYFSFTQLATVSGVEPDKDQWDIQITRYNYTFYTQTPPLRYEVNGVLLNPSHTTAYKDSLTDYTAIDLGFATGVPLSTLRDAVGYDWKYYDYTSSNPKYTIVKKYNYIIRNQNDHYFKLHFLDFYSAQGVKGSPEFEYYQLN